MAQVYLIERVAGTEHNRGTRKFSRMRPNSNQSDYEWGLHLQFPRQRIRWYELKDGSYYLRDKTTVLNVKAIHPF